MKRSVWLGLLAVVIAAVAVSIIALPKGPEWTTSSPEALAEFELALQARMKLYYVDSIDHLEKAVALDPDFLMARLMLADHAKWDDRADADELMAPVLAADVDALKPRERFFIERARANHDKRTEDAEALLQEYLERYPNDPFLLEAAAGSAMHRGDNETAERLYRRLLEVGPNWVIAYNQLGYITMLQGRFAEAEEYFTSYRFIAPDQANPHDSLGELYLILGRLPEAEQSFETAIQIKPDFWESYSHLVLARALLDDYAGAHEAAHALEGVEGCPKLMPTRLDCLATFIELELSGRWRDILDPASSECVTEEYPVRLRLPRRPPRREPARRVAGRSRYGGASPGLPGRGQGEGRIVEVRRGDADVAAHAGSPALAVGGSEGRRKGVQRRRLPPHLPELRRRPVQALQPDDAGGNPAVAAA